MRKLLWFGLAPIVFAAAVSAPAQTPPAQQTITLYSPIQYNHDFSRAAVNFQLTGYGQRNTPADLIYGFAHLGEDFDWFMKSSARDDRSVMLDLGKHAWTDSFNIPWLEPLKPGEGQGVFVSTSGAEGKDGKPGFGAGDGNGLSALPSGGGGTNPPACCDSSNTPSIDRGYPTESPRRAKRPAGVQTSPNLLRTNLDHIYVIHVVDDKRDFYALFRVDALQRGDNCTISWKMVPAPPQPTTVKK